MVKKQEGITLVALVITIVVMLILAGVSISLVVGNNGVLTQASSAVVQNNVAGVKEDVEMAISAAEMAYYTAWGSNTAIQRGDTTKNFYGTTGNVYDELIKAGYTTVTISANLVDAISPTIKVYEGSDVYYLFTLGTTGVSSSTGEYSIVSCEYCDGSSTTTLSY